MLAAVDRKIGLRMILPRTYELYICDGTGERTFEALTCPRSELLRYAREALERHGAETVEIWEAGEHLLTLAA
jgi:hypothetical protein